MIHTLRLDAAWRMRGLSEHAVEVAEDPHTQHRNDYSMSALD